MKIIFSEQFQQVCLGEFQIKVKDVRNTIISPNKKCVLKLNSLDIGIFLSPESEGEFYLLVIASKRDGNWHVLQGFKILAELLDGATRPDPLQVLKILVSKFGLSIKIGDYTEKFIMDERIRVPLGSKDPLELIECEMESSHSGLMCAIAGFDQSDGKKYLNCALVFSIDTYAYSSWLFGWKDPLVFEFASELDVDISDMGNISEFALSPSETIDAYSSVIKLRIDDDKLANDLAKYRGACLYLAKLFGDYWYRKLISIHFGADSQFMPKSWAEDIDMYKYVVRVIQLANFIHMVKDVPGIKEKIEEFKEKADPIESIWFETFIPSTIQNSGHQLLLFVPTDKLRKTPDAIIKFRDSQIPIEIKTNKFETAFSRRTLLNPLKDAFSQLPDAGPGVIFLMIPSEWINDSTFQQKAESVINRALERNRNCNAIFVYWPANFKLPTGEFAFTWRFQHFTNWTPMKPIRRIIDLIEKAEMTYKSIDAAFLDKAV